MIAVGRALRLQATAGRRESIGVLELPREMRAVGEACLVGDVGDRTVGILDEPIRVAHTQTAIERSGAHPDMLATQPFELPRRESEFGSDCRDRNGTREILL